MQRREAPIAVNRRLMRWLTANSMASDVKQYAAKALVQVLGLYGYTLARIQPKRVVPVDLPPEATTIIDDVSEFTKTSPERIYALYEAVRYIERRGIPGAIVECGVWRGGSMMAAAKTLMQLHSVDRELYLFDTFTGMTPPSSHDVDLRGDAAQELLQRGGPESNIWAFAPLDDVRANLASTNYPLDRIRFIEGRVEDTIPAHAPREIALLRLDTDWYTSTAHELTHLVPRMADGAVLIIDDYGHWQGARKAVDEYFASYEPAVYFTRVDYSGRVAIVERKQAAVAAPALRTVEARRVDIRGSHT